MRGHMQAHQQCEREQQQPAGIALGAPARFRHGGGDQPQDRREREAGLQGAGTTIDARRDQRAEHGRDQRAARLFEAETARDVGVQRLDRNANPATRDAAAVQDLGLFDLILCRNVLIYFRDARTQQVLKHLTAALQPGGVLVVGVSESLLRFGTALVCEERAGSFFYRKVR